MKTSSTSQTTFCQMCGKKIAYSKLVPAGLVRPVVVEIIKKTYPDWQNEGYICTDDLNKYRHEYLRSILEQEKGELSVLEKGVIESLAEHEILSADIDQKYETTLSLGEKLSDRIAAFGGSWKFLIIFACIIFIWIFLNSLFLLSKPFDPYPFILLNLILSCLAAVQAPIIMMSQNRQDAKDRLRGAHDYQINLKAELEIQHLHQKVDHLLMRQWERLFEIQELQMELMEEVQRRKI